MCEIQEKTEPNQNLTITLEVHEGEVEGRYSIDGTAQMSGFSFVVRTIVCYEYVLLTYDINI